MKINIDYNKCLTNLASSISKYFGIEPFHNTLDSLDDALSSNPKNVVLILCDGMGYNILNRTLDKDSFLVSHIKEPISSVFPPTTTAATTSVMTGLNPNEHCWLGWEIYIKDVNNVVIMYQNKIKDTDIHFDENICQKYMPYQTIMDRINKEGKYYAAYISLYGDIGYEDFHDMCNKIKQNLNKKDRNYIYAYYENPDTYMHLYGADSKEVVEEINMINFELERLCNGLEDTLVIIIADHGHMKQRIVYLEDYPELFECLERTTSIDSRSAMYFIKDGMSDYFKDRFIKEFDDNFILLDRNQIFEYNLFGTGNNHPYFDSCIGDFISISNKNLSIKYKRKEGKVEAVSSHAGNTTDETEVPLVLVKKR